MTRSCRGPLGNGVYLIWLDLTAISVSCWQFLDVLHGLGRVLKVSSSWYDNPGISKDQLSNHTQLTAYWCLLLVLATFPFSISYALTQFDKFSVFWWGFFIAREVAVTATNLTNSSETLCVDEDSACLLWLFCRMRNRSLVSEREFTCLIDQSVTSSFLAEGRGQLCLRSNTIARSMILAIMTSQ